MPRGQYDRTRFKRGNKGEHAGAATAPAEVKKPAKRGRTTTAAVKAQSQTVGSFAVEMSEPYYWWLSVTADALGLSCAEVLNMIMAQHIKNERKK